MAQVFRFRYAEDHNNRDDPVPNEGAAVAAVAGEGGGGGGGGGGGQRELAPPAVVAPPLLPSPRARPLLHSPRPAPEIPKIRPKLSDGAKYTFTFITVVIVATTILLVLITMLFILWNGVLLRITTLINPMSVQCTAVIVFLVIALFVKPICEHLDAAFPVYV